MKRKYIDYIILLSVFILILLSSNINYFIKVINHNFNFSNVINNINQSIIMDNNRLKNIIKIDNKYDFITSKLKFRDIYNFTDNILIYKGKNDNVKKNMLVLSDKNVIGKVTKVFKNTSLVELLTNKKSTISVKINNSYGILKYNGKDIYVSNLTSDDDINIKDEVFTSGITDIKGDILIGRVKKVINDDKLLEKKVILDKLDITNINYVVLI